MSEKAKNTSAEDMTQETIRVRSAIQERQRINNAPDLSMSELQEAAAGLGVDTSGAKSKQDVREKILGTGSAGPTDAGA